MNKRLILVSIIVGNIFLSGCVSESSANATDETDFTSIDFKIASQGTQTDLPGGQIIEARNADRFNNIWLTIPSISGVSPNPDFEVNQVVVLLSTISACSSLEITDVSENSYTRLISATEVFSSDPGLCDPTPEAFRALEYAMVEFERGGYRPVSVIYKRRNDY